MKLRYKVAGGFLIFLAVTLSTLAFVLNYNFPCGTAHTFPDDVELMKAVVNRCYGSPDVLKFEDVEKPIPGDNEVLVKVHAASVNTIDRQITRGDPFYVRLFGGILKPKYQILGIDIAGRVEAVGSNIKEFQPGDEVFGSSIFGGFAEYVSVSKYALVPKPENISFEQAATIFAAASTVLLALRDEGHIQPGQKVLINGASGGLGTFAVQIARAFGAEVTAVCSTRNVEIARSLGADHVIDYKKQDFTKIGQQYDLILAVNGYHWIFDYKRSLKPEGIYVAVGGTIGQALQAIILGPIISMIGSQKMGFTIPTPRQKDLFVLKELLETGKLVPVIDRRYTLSEVPEAIRYLEEGHAQGKVVINIE